MVSSHYCLFCFFFFSSRRRHTRWTGDWSSDVCSSDLVSRLPRLMQDRTRDVSAEHARAAQPAELMQQNRETIGLLDRKSTRLNSSHPSISYAVFCLKKKKKSKKKINQSTTSIINKSKP